MKKAHLIKVNNTDIRLRPSSIDSFYDCSYKWGKTYLEGVNHGTNSRAAIGTSIHAAVEQAWTDIMKTGDKEAFSLSAATDAAMEAWKEESANGMQFDEGETNGTAAVEIVRGTQAFIDDIIPFSKIPTAVEKFYEIPLDAKLVSSIGGTVDYITDNTIADVKTSKRKISAAKHITQQSIYTLLAKANGVAVKHNLIQGVVLTKNPSGEILMLEPDEELARTRVNGILEVTDAIASGVAPELLLRGNPSGNMCSPKYCALYNSGCPYVKGEKPQAAVGFKL